MKLTQRRGQLITRVDVKENTGDKRTLIHEEKTTILKPFTNAPVHADVGATLRVTVSENYQSITVGCSVTIPTDPDEDAAQRAFTWAHDFCDRNLSEKLKDVRRVLRKMSNA